MKNKSKIAGSFLGLLAVILIGFGCSTQSADVSGEIREANKVLMDAVVAGDTAVLSGIYTADAKLYPANSGVIDGKEAIGKFWAATLQMGIKKTVFETESALAYGNIAIEEGKYALYVDGDIMVDEGKYIVTWKMDGGKWKVYRDIWNGSNPPPVQRAKANENVMIIINPVKEDKVAQFENFYQNYLVPAGVKTSPQVKATVRLQKPVAKGKDGVYTYVFFMDPYVETFDYDMGNVLSAAYGEEKAKEYFKMYMDCLKDSKTEVYFLTETGW